MLRSKSIYFALSIVLMVVGWAVNPDVAAGASHSEASSASKSALAFDLPSQSVLKGSKKKVFAHYFTPYPLSVDNQPPANDYYARHYLKPTGEKSKHARYGGLLRDRPIPETPQSGDWLLDNFKKEVRVASAAGLDGFTVDVLSVSSRNWTWTKKLIKAAEQADPNFKIVLMPDMYSMKTQSASEIAAAMASVSKSPSVFKLDDGRMVIAPFKAEGRSAKWWTDFLNTMERKHGVKVAFVPTFLNFPDNFNEFRSISYGFGNWGNRNPAHNRKLDANIELSHLLGKIWMQPVSVQDSRPNQGIFDEANNTENLRMTWDAAIAGADWVQIPTWNDYSEGTQLWSQHNGYTYLDISSYYLTWFKTGKAPRITNDVAYLTHRIQRHDAEPTYSYPKHMKLRRGSTAPRDTVEVLTFLKAPAKITAKVGSKVHTYSAPAGMHVKTFPLQTGTNAVTIKRNGVTVDSVTSPWTVKTRPYVQDLQYYGVTSGR